MTKILMVIATAIVIAGTLATANVRRTALHGAQLPNRVLVQAFADDDITLIQHMRDYMRSLGYRR